MSMRVENRVFGKVKSAALQEALRIVRQLSSARYWSSTLCNMVLILGEYGSTDIDDEEFEADSKLQDEMISRYESVSSEGDLRRKELLKRYFQS